MNKHKAAVRATVAENAICASAYVVMNVLATIVASYGLLADSAAVVIGAIIIAMLLGPISGIGLALDDGDYQLLWKAAIALVCGIDLMLALGGGAAGAYAVSSPRLSVAFVGVAIATALVPSM